jgi:hypothetical protein
MLSPEAAPLLIVASLVETAEKTPFDAMLHLRSAVGLLTLANGPDADHTGVAARIWIDHGPFDAIVSVGPVLELKPAVKSAGVGLVRIVEVELICAHTNEVAVIDTVEEMMQPPAPIALQICANVVAGAAETTIINDRTPIFISPGAPP